MKWIFRIIDFLDSERKIREVHIFAETKAETMKRVRKNYLKSSIHSCQLSGCDKIVLKNSSPDQPGTGF